MLWLSMRKTRNSRSRLRPREASMFMKDLFLQVEQQVQGGKAKQAENILTAVGFPAPYAASVVGRMVQERRERRKARENWEQQCNLRQRPLWLVDE